MVMDEKILLQSSFWERMRFKQKKNPGNFKILSVSKTEATLHTIFSKTTLHTKSYYFSPNGNR